MPPADPGRPAGEAPPTREPARDRRHPARRVAAGTINTVVGSGTLITFPTLLAFGIPPVTANVSNTVGTGARLAVGGDRLPAELVGQRARLFGSAPPRCSVASPVPLLLLVLPASAFDAIVPVLIVLGCVLVILGPRISKRVAARAEARGGLAEHGAWWVWPAVRWPGCTAATSAPPRESCCWPSSGSGWTTRCSGTTRPRTSWRCSSTVSRRVVFILVARRRLGVAGLIAVRVASSAVRSAPTVRPPAPDQRAARGHRRGRRRRHPLRLPALTAAPSDGAAGSAWREHAARDGPAATTARSMPAFLRHGTGARPRRCR